MEAILIGALVGGLIFRFWQWIVAGLVIGLILLGVKWVVEFPQRAHVRSHMEFNQTVIQLNKYEWGVAYRVANHSDVYTVTNLRFSCDGGKSQISVEEFAPGNIYAGILRIPFAEGVKNCSPEYDLEKQ